MARKRKHVVPLGDGSVAVDIGHEGRRAIFPARQIEGTENDFTGSSDEWEARVFDNAAYFHLHRFNANGSQDKMRVETFPEAVTMATAALDDPNNPNARVLIYAVTATERHIALPQKKWPDYLVRWGKNHGTG